MHRLTSSIARRVTSSSLMRDTRGLSTVEYIIILVLIAVAGIALWQEFGNAVMDRIGQSTDAINGM